MNSLLKAIFNEFAAKIIAKYEIDATPEAIYAEYKETVRSLTFSIVKKEAETGSEDETAPAKAKAQAKPKAAAKSKAAVASEKTCPYKAKKGANAGVVCGKGAAKDSIMCSSHKKYAGDYEKVVDSDQEEEMAQQLKSKLTVNLKATQETKSEAKGCCYVFSRGERNGQRCGVGQVVGTDYCSKHTDKSKVKPKTEIVPKPKATTEKFFVRDASGRFVMKGDRPLVCKSATDKIIVGKLEDDAIVALDEDDITYCEENKLKYESAGKKNIEKALEDVLDEVTGKDEDIEEDDGDEDVLEEEILEEDE
jgi:hypothetical protein